ncbi:MAG: hypothetical protein ACI9UA_006033, partial [Pseudoalteromonas tetraodonis]
MAPAKILRLPLEEGVFAAFARNHRLAGGAALGTQIISEKRFYKTHKDVDRPVGLSIVDACEEPPATPN